MGKITGVVDHFDKEKGYGVINGDDGRKYIFFYRDILKKNKNARSKEKVLFSTIKDAHGTRAVGVHFV